MLLAFVLSGLVFTNTVQPWHILVLSFLLGTANAFEMPARQSLVADLVDREDLTNAIALNVTMFNTAMIAGPAIAGVVYALAGPAWCFTINGISYLAVLAALALMILPPRLAQVRQASALTSIVEGIQYVRAQPLVRTLTLSAFFYNIYDYAMIIFIPAFAVELLNGDSSTNGLLLSANAAGAVIGGLVLAVLASRIGRGRIWAVSAYTTPLVIALFAISRFLPLSLLMTVIIGITSITVLSNTSAMIQSSISDDLRGRVMSLYSLMIMSGGPLGALLLGWVADRAGETVLALTCAAIALVFALGIRLLAPQVIEMN